MTQPHPRTRLLFALLLLTGCSAQPALQPAPASHATPAPVAEPTFPTPVITVAGDPDTLGRAYARQLSQPMHELLQGYLHRWFTNDTARSVAHLTASAFARHLRPHHYAELQAVANATGIDLADALLAQCFLDLSPMTACSSIALPADAFTDGIPRLARNLDFPALDIADRHSIVVLFRPEGRYQFAAITWPGLLGVLSGINEHGLVLVNMEVARTRRLPTAMPYTYLYRTVLEECRTVDQAVRLLQDTPRQSANNIMLMDATGARAVVELTPQTVTVRTPGPAQPLISTNHHRGADHATPGRCDRYDRLLADARRTAGHADRTDLADMLQHVQQGRTTLQSMIFEPTTRTLYLSTGQRAADKPMHRLNLAPLFADH